MQTRVSHLVREPEDGPRIVWAPLAIIAVSFALWAGFWLSVKWAWEVFL